MDYFDEVCFDSLSSHERLALHYIIQRDEPITHASIMVGGMNPNNVTKYKDHHRAVTGD